MSAAEQTAPATLPSLTLAEALAMAILKGDMAAAYALADLLHDDPGRDRLNEAARVAREAGGRANGRDVYGWPEFRAFARRLGFLWDHLTVDVAIFIPPYGPVQVTHKYQGVNVEAPADDQEQTP